MAIHDPAAAEQGGRFARGGAVVDDEPEQRGWSEAERVREPAQVVGLERAGAGWRHNQKQLPFCSHRRGRRLRGRVAGRRQWGLVAGRR